MRRKKETAPIEGAEETTRFDEAKETARANIRAIAHRRGFDASELRDRLQRMGLQLSPRTVDSWLREGPNGYLPSIEFLPYTLVVLGARWDEVFPLEGAFPYRVERSPRTEYDKAVVDIIHHTFDLWRNPQASPLSNERMNEIATHLRGLGTIENFNHALEDEITYGKLIRFEEDHPVFLPELEEEIKTSYGLSEVEVRVLALPGDPNNLFQNQVYRSAYFHFAGVYLRHLIDSLQTRRIRQGVHPLISIGLASGHTIEATLQAIPRGTLGNVELTPFLHLSNSLFFSTVSSPVIAGAMVNKHAAYGVYLAAPEEDRTLKNVDLLIASLGGTQDSSVNRVLRAVSIGRYEEGLSSPIAGDVLLNLLTADGRIASELDAGNEEERELLDADRILREAATEPLPDLAILSERLKRAKLNVFLAVGKKKAKIVRALLLRHQQKTPLVSSIILDRQLAESLVALAHE